jgi:hypothetical protein
VPSSSSHVRNFCDRAQIHDRVQIHVHDCHFPSYPSRQILFCAVRLLYITCQMAGMRNLCVAYKFICLVCEPLPVLLTKLIKNVHYNFSVTELPALFIWDQKILSTCIEWNILTSDQLTFISWPLGTLAFSLSNLCHRVTGKPHPKNTLHFLNCAS